MREQVTERHKVAISRRWGNRGFSGGRSKLWLICSQSQRAMIGPFLWQTSCLVEHGKASGLDREAGDQSRQLQLGPHAGAGETLFDPLGHCLPEEGCFIAEQAGGLAKRVILGHDGRYEQR
jgi:hypothetical protein